MLCLALATLFVLSSFAQFSISSTAAAVSIPNGEPSASFADRHQWSSSGWDWESLADDSGYVDLIVVPDKGPADGRLFLESRSVLSERFSIAPRTEFRLAFDGFTVRVDIGTLRSILESEDLPFSFYPDLPVNATLADSVAQIGADQLHAQTDANGDAVTGLGVVVAILDTGVDYDHPDLGGGFGPGYKVVGGYDFVNDDPDPMDDNGHGTHVAGIVAASGGIEGVAPDATILAYKVLSASGSGSMSDVILGIEAAMDPDGDGDTSDHADVISMSLGGSGDVDDPVCISVAEAVAAGIVVVVAAGNSGPALGTVASPGLAPEAVTVGAADDSWALAEFSSRGTMPDLAIKPEISAPGVDIVSTIPGDGYGSMSGTSMATPHVSGGAALLIQLHPTWTPEQVKSAIVTGAWDMTESLWSAGSGGLWLPDAADTTMFFDPCIVSYGSSGDPSQTVSARNLGGSVTVSSSSSDWYSMSADGLGAAGPWTNESAVSPASVTIPSSGSQTFTLAVPMLDVSSPEGYYDGYCQFSFASSVLKVPFGFALLSSVTVHVLDIEGDEVFDPYGGVWIYTHPDAEIGMGVTGELDPAPPATFLVPSGTYNVHAAGHHLIYSYSSPYLLSDSVSVGRGESLEVYLKMSSAYAMTIDLETDGGDPIYVKDFRMYARHVGASNVSFHLVGSDYSVVGSDMFSLPKAQVVYVSPTDATVGISVAGYSYTPLMWDFMERNWEHWYEYPDSISTAFQIESSADLRYLLAWEFEGVDSSSDTSLELVPGMYSVYDMKYDIPGAISNPWGYVGTHLSLGGDASFYIRRDTEASISPIFSGINRRTVVQGVFSSPYSPGSLFEGFFEQQHYIPDYSRLVKANTISPIYLPDRNFLAPIEGETGSGRVGSGPYYAAIWTENTNDTIAMYQPLLRDQSGAKVGGMYYPCMNLKKDGMVTGYYQFAEFLARPDAVRFIPISAAGFYEAIIEYVPTPQMCSDVTITLGFNIPGGDLDPPVIQSLVMPQRFVPGQQVPIAITASDTGSVFSASALWRAGSSDDWASVSLVTADMLTYTALIPTSSSDSAIDIMVVLEDSSGNYINYTTANAALAQVPVVFDIEPSVTDIGYRSGDASVVLTGRLTTASGDPLSDSCCVPIELLADGSKVGMLLDEYMSIDSHVHDGNIRFEWHFNPANLFSSVGETVQVDAVFDLGIYEARTVSFELTSIEYTNLPPEIALVSPADGSLIDAGTVVDLEITDSGTCSAEAFLDGASLGQLSDPWDIDTSTWSDGVHILLVLAVDDAADESSADFQFEVDSLAPVVEILSPDDGASVPTNWTIEASATDTHLASVTYSLDGGPENHLSAPYVISMVGWEPGSHVVSVTATDAVGHASSDTVAFTIEEGSLVLSILSPEDGSVVQSGIQINVSALGEGTVTVSWTEGETSYSVDDSWSILTDGWSEGVHELLVTAWSDLGGYDEQWLTITIDDTMPEIVLESPAEFSFVTPLDVILMGVVDDNFDSVSYILWGATRISSWSDMYVSLFDSPGDGYFTLNVTARDLAGNTANRQLVFAMDSEAPVVSAEDFESGDAVLPGTVIDLSVTDFFLADVEWAWDGAEPQGIQEPFQIDTASISDGWQLMQVEATDYSGKTGWLNLSIFIDDSGPSITPAIVNTFVAGEPMDLGAIVEDDYSVGSVLLFHELPGGSYDAMTMRWDGTMYVVSLAPDALWDGMTVYIQASDAVGHVSQSDVIVLQSTAAPPVDDGGGADDDAADPGGISWSLIALGSTFAAAVVVMLSLLLSRSRRDTRPGKPARPSVGAADARKIPAPIARQGPVRGPAQGVPRQKTFSQGTRVSSGAGVAQGPRVSGGLEIKKHM